MAQLTGLWHYCCLLLGSFFCAGNEFFHACFSGLGLFKSTVHSKKQQGPSLNVRKKTLDLRYLSWMQVQGLPSGEKQADATVQIPQLTLAMQPAWTLFPAIG